MHIQREFIRKGLHTTLAMAYAVFALFVSEEVLIGVALGLGVVFVFIRFTHLHTHIHKLERVSFGELFFVAGVVTTALLTLPEDVFLFQTAMVILALADTFASLMGMRFGNHSYNIYDEKRTMEGSGACLVASLCVLVFFDLPFLQALYIATALTIVEAVSLRGSDNLFLPLATVVLVHYFV